MRPVIAGTELGQYGPFRAQRLSNLRRLESEAP